LLRPLKTPEMISILIADDHKLIRETWTYILNRDSRFKVVGSCSNSEEAVKMSETLQPEIVLMDINMAPFSGIEATRRIRETSPNSRIIYAYATYLCQENVAAGCQRLRNQKFV
jgi:DNA-binding NarL/FixJ family response regulator